MLGTESTVKYRGEWLASREILVAFFWLHIVLLNQDCTPVARQGGEEERGGSGPSEGRAGVCDCDCAVLLRCCDGAVTVL